jgi:hypothetical protein
MPSQLTLNFEPGLNDRFHTWEDCIAGAVYSSRQGLNAVAGTMDMSPSELSRRLNRDSEDVRPLRAKDAIKIIEATGDLRPVYWLVEKFLRDPDAVKQEALAQIPNLVKQLNALLEASGATDKLRTVK